MKLLLELLGPPRLMGARRQFELRDGSLSVGRSPEADWTISDTDRLISRLHLRIDASHGDFVLTDTSANGVYVNGSDEPVGYGASIGLRDGDRLRIGEAEIAVTVDPDHARPGTPPAPTPGSRFDLNADAFAAQLAAPARRDPFGGPFAAEPPVSAPAAPIARAVVGSDWMNGPVAPSPPETPFAPGRDRGEAVVLPLRPGGVPPAEPLTGGRTVPQRGAPAATAPGPGLLALVEARPDLSARRLAAAFDAAAQTLEPREWREIEQKIKSIVNQ